MKEALPLLIPVLFWSAALSVYHLGCCELRGLPPLGQYHRQWRDTIRLLLAGIPWVLIAAAALRIVQRSWAELIQLITQ